MLAHIVSVENSCAAFLWKLMHFFLLLKNLFINVYIFIHSLICNNVQTIIVIFLFNLSFIKLTIS